jgi:phosphoribosylformylglycinamidine cyclo-ligase
MSYKNSGVDVHAADQWVEGIQNKIGTQELISGVGDYAAVYKLNDREWVATSCDGIGTKILWTLKGIGTPKDLAQDLLAMNVNDVLCTGATPKLFLDYIACSGKEALQENGFLKKFIYGLADICKENEQILAGGETAQMPDLYKGEEFDTAGFSVGFMEPENYIHPQKLEEGAELWGWTSNGPHSNGFTWLRKLFDSEKDAETIRNYFMAPTRIYIKEFRDLRKKLEAHSCLAAYHVTGSGLLNLLRSQNQWGFELTHWPKELPSWLQVIQERSKASNAELLSTFNGGYGFIVAIKKAGAQQSTLLEQSGLKFLGSVSSKPGVRIPQLEAELI